MKTCLEKWILEFAPYKCLEEELSRTGRGVASSIMHTPHSGIHSCHFPAHLSILGKATVVFLYIWASEFFLRKITKIN